MSQRTTNAARAHAKAAAASRADRPAPPTASGGLGAGLGADLQASRPGFRAWLRYRFDLTLARGSGALIGWLAVVTAVFVVITGLFYGLVVDAAAVDGEDSGLLESSWQSLMRTLDPGTVTGDEGWPRRLASLFITVVGIFIFSTLIGLIASVIDRAIEGLRKGRGVVPETEHTLVLGWSEKLHTIISELRIANANQRRSCVVVLAPRDRVEMEDEINARDGEGAFGSGGIGSRVARLFGRGPGRTRVVCRTGNPADPADLALVAPAAARSIIVLGEDDSAGSDAQVTKVLLGLMAFDRELTGMHVLAEFHDAENAAAMAEAAGSNVHMVVSSDLIARITAQICRQSGLGAVYQELLDFDGDEVYFHADGALDGARWAQVQLALEESSGLGIRRADGSVQLNPPADAQFAPGDELIAISEDDDTIVVGPLGEWDAAAHAGAARTQLPPDHLLMVGWNDLAPKVLQHLAGAVTAGSTVDVVVDPALVTVEEGQVGPFERLEVRVSEADTSRLEPLRRVLDERDYERIVLVGYRGLEPAEADARTLLGLVHARRILDADHRNHGTSIVAELLEPRSVQLGRVANPDDFVVSERLASLLMAQVSENGQLAAVFGELLDGTGVELLVKPARDYVDAASGAGPVAWRELVRAASLRDESAIGYVSPQPGGGGVVVNPPKSTMVELTAEFELIVVA